MRALGQWLKLHTGGVEAFDEVQNYLKKIDNPEKKSRVLHTIRHGRYAHLVRMMRLDGTVIKNYSP